MRGRRHGCWLAGEGAAGPGPAAAAWGLSAAGGEARGEGRREGAAAGSVASWGLVSRREGKVGRAAGVRSGQSGHLGGMLKGRLLRSLAGCWKALALQRRWCLGLCAWG